MSDDPMENVYSYVERAYVRLQAGDLLTRCMEEVSVGPIQQLVESLIVAGPTSLSALREIFAEAERRKVQVQDDLHQLFKELETSLHSYGVRLNWERPGMQYTRLTPVVVLKLLHDQRITDGAIQAACLQLLQDSRDLADNLNNRLDLLEEIENYLQDWLWSAAYQSARPDAPVFRH